VRSATAPLQDRGSARRIPAGLKKIDRSPTGPGTRSGRGPGPSRGLLVGQSSNFRGILFQLCRSSRPRSPYMIWRRGRPIYRPYSRRRSPCQFTTRLPRIAALRRVRWGSGVNITPIAWFQARSSTRLQRAGVPPRLQRRIDSA